MITIKPLGHRRGSAPLAPVALAMFGLLLLAAALAVSQVRPRPVLSQAEVEQRAVRDTVARGIGRIERVVAHSTTLGRLRPGLRCEPAESIYRAIRFAARADTYNPCDPATRLWVVELWADYPSWVFEPARMIYTAAGDFVRSEGGP